MRLMVGIMINNEMGTMLDFLEENSIICNCDGDKIFLLQVNGEDYDKVLDKATNLGLTFHIHEVIKEYREGLITGNLRVHLARQSIDFSIEKYEKTIHELGKIYYTARVDTCPRW